MKGKRKRGRPRKTWKYYASEEGEQECWFEEGGCIVSSERVGEIAARVG